MTSCARPAQTADAQKQIKRSEPSSEAEKKRERDGKRKRERGRASDLQPMGSIWFPVHNIANRTFMLRCCVPLAAFISWVQNLFWVELKLEKIGQILLSIRKKVRLLIIKQLQFEPQFLYFPMKVYRIMKINNSYSLSNAS